ncbi:hypothetical protein QBC38DRAFT_138834 [Podospora fimiseda]|uniref:Uncharacterized protein n=1 Tax=Podospora fimiseda TaxID=252190 RepID=A0AAN7BGG7_9PEZI|nr:hypothetical protein QBC38DRAFT_138834 [Podospora fimiseda]
MNNPNNPPGHIDPDEIHQFIRNLRPSDGAGSYPQSYHNFVPRSTHSVSIDLSAYGGSNYPRSEREYTTTTSSRSSRTQPQSTIMSSGQSTATRSYYSHHWDDQSVASYRTDVSSAPSRRSHIQDFNAQAHHATAPHDQSLWCEFSELLGCNAMFALNDRNGWINHHVEHFGDNNIPSKSRCWFCDGRHFIARHQSQTYEKFVDRLEHIHRHIMEDDRLTADHTRPDFDVVDHMHQIGLLSQERYDTAMTFDELPNEYQLPAWATSSSSSRPRGQQRQPAQSVVVRERRQRRL